MNKTILAAFFLVAFAVFSAASDCTDGGVVKLQYDARKSIISDRKARLRGFLWEHWRNHNRAKIAVAGVTAEGADWSEKYIVEVGANGQWRIAVEFRGKDFDPNLGTSSERSDHYYAYFVERIDESGHSIAINEQRNAHSYELVLKDHSRIVRRQI